MAFGKPFAPKPRTPEPVRPVTAALVRIVLLALIATAAAGYGMYLYYTHRLLPPERRPAAAPSASGEIEAPELLPLGPPSASSGADAR